MVSRSSDPRALPDDTLSEVLRDLRLSGVSYGRCEFTSPWGIELPPANAMRFHFVAEGECWLRTPHAEWTRLRQGDVALIPRGKGHLLANAPSSKTLMLDELPFEAEGERSYRLRASSSGDVSLLYCCTVILDQPALHPLLELMPPALLVRGAATKDATLPVLLETMAEEVAAERVGATTVLERLADVVIARIIRTWVEAQCEQPSGWLAAIRDPKVGRALAAIHRNPGRRWTIEALADLARTSRSIFVERFTATVGIAPSRYLTRWRMQLASEWLRTDQATVSQAATRLGYESEAAFSRAFKRNIGVPPSAVRRGDLRR
jgi:AraC-like DNA-binding protein